MLLGNYIYSLNLVTWRIVYSCKTPLVRKSSKHHQIAVDSVSTSTQRFIGTSHLRESLEHGCFGVENGRSSSANDGFPKVS